MWNWLKSVWFQVTLGSCFSFVQISTDHEDRGTVLFGRLFVCKSDKYWQGVCLVDWTEVNPGKLSTVVPVEEHTRLVSPGQDTCDLDGGVEFWICVGSGFCQSKFCIFFTLCRCVVCGRRPCGLGSILVGVCVMV